MKKIVVILVLLTLLMPTISYAKEVSYEQVGVQSQSAHENECFEGESCAIWWQFISIPYCGGGVYILKFCLNPEDPGNREFHHYHQLCLITHHTGFDYGSKHGLEITQ